MLDNSPPTLKFCPLASGSKGNSYWVEYGETTLLVDAGLSYRRLSARVEEIGRSMEQVDHIFITHEHNDHVQALAQILKRHRPVLWASGGTLRAIRKQIVDGARVRMMNSQEEQVGEFVVKSIPISHDAVEPFAYRFDVPGASLAILTDLGEWTGEILKEVGGVDALICEANHDPDMLEKGVYPFVLKRRIASTRGHLSNQEGAELAAKTVELGARCVVLGHISESNNSPSLALDVFEKAIERRGLSAKLDVAMQDRPGPWVEVRVAGNLKNGVSEQQRA